MCLPFWRSLFACKMAPASHLNVPQQPQHNLLSFENLWSSVSDKRGQMPFASALLCNMRDDLNGFIPLGLYGHATMCPCWINRHGLHINYCMGIEMGSPGTMWTTIGKLIIVHTAQLNPKFMAGYPNRYPHCTNAARWCWQCRWLRSGDMKHLRNTRDRYWNVRLLKGLSSPGWQISWLIQDGHTQRGAVRSPMAFSGELL